MQRAGAVSFWQITPNNLLESITALYKGENTFRTILDRSQYDPRFEPIHRWSREHNVRRINPAEVSAWSEDKATMHLELISAGIHTPYTILLSPFIEQPVLPDLDLTPLGDQFVIKPSNGGGGEGVILGAFSMDQILRARMEFPEQKYLIQATVMPRTIQGQPAWFRIFYRKRQNLSLLVASAYACLFNGHTPGRKQIRTHCPARRSHSASLPSANWIGSQPRSPCTLEEFVVVDYVNDGIDTRVQSKAVDGVPDEVMQGIAEQLVMIAKGEKDERAHVIWGFHSKAPPGRTTPSQTFKA